MILPRSMIRCPLCTMPEAGDIRGQHVLAGGTGFHRVDRQVGFQILVDVAACHHAPRIPESVGMHNVFVGRTGGVKFREGMRFGFRAVDNLDARHNVLGHLCQFVGIDDTGLVNRGKQLFDVVQITYGHTGIGSVQVVRAERHNLVSGAFGASATKKG